MFHNRIAQLAILTRKKTRIESLINFNCTQQVNGIDFLFSNRLVQETSFLTDQRILGRIRSPAMDVSTQQIIIKWYFELVFVCVGVLCLQRKHLLSTDQVRRYLQIMPLFLNVVQSNFLHYRVLIYKKLVTVELNLRRKNVFY